MKLTRCQFEVKWADLWVGLFWRTTHAATDRGREPPATDVWICLLPCVPLHLTFARDVATPAHQEASGHGEDEAIA